MAPNMVLVTLLPTLVTFLVTSGVWVGVFFIVGLNQPSSVSNYYYGANSSTPTSSPPIPPNPSYPPIEQCPAAGQYSACSVDCDIQICETIPSDLYPGVDRGTWSTTKCWLKLIELAEKEIVIGSYYWTLLVAETDGCTDLCNEWSADGKQIYDGLMDAAKRGIKIRIAMNEPDKDYSAAEPLAIRDANPEKVQVRALDFARFMGGGILHTKSWAVDGKHSYVGSANFDWRSLSQVKEIGVATFNCACVAEDVQRMIDVYWYMGAEDAVVPAQWPAEYTTNANHDHPYNVPRKEGPATAIHFSSAPPPLDSCGRDSDIESMIKMIDEAEDYLYMAVMDYAPATIYSKPTNSYYERLDAAIKRAAFDRFVDVKFMMSKWQNSKAKLFSFMHEFDEFSNGLPCRPGSKGSDCERGKIEVRIYQMPEDDWKGIPYARVQHTKYFVTEKGTYIGTSNWTADYWIVTGGIGIGIRSADHGGQEKLAEQVKSLYMMDWNSQYATPISKFTTNGTRIDD